jgi:hypothetical protein
MRKVRRTAFLEMSLGHVDFGLCSGEIGLILFGKTIAIGERERLVLGRETAGYQQG